MSRLEQLEKMLAVEPDDVFLNFAVAMELCSLSRHDESAVRFDRAIELDPNYVSAYFQKGRMLASIGEEDGARQSILIGIERAQANGDMHAKGEMEEFLAMLS